MDRAIDKGTLLYKIALTLCLSANMFRLSIYGYMNVFGNFLNILNIVSAVIICWKILEDNKYDQKQVIRYCICMALILIITVVSKNELLLFTFLFLIAVKNVRFSEVIRQALITNSICLCIIMVSSWLGIINDRVYDVFDRMRHSCGFDFATVSSNYLLYLILMYIFLRKYSIKIWELLFLQAINLYFFWLNDTRYSFALATFAILTSFLLTQLKKKDLKIQYWGIKYIGWIGTIAVIILAYLYDTVKFVSDVIDPFLSGRIHLSRSAILEYGYTLFGQNIRWVGGNRGFETISQEYNYVDTSYLQLLLTYGVLALILILLGIYFLAKEIEYEKDYYFGLVLFCVCIHGIFYTQFQWLYYNTFIIALGYLFITDRNERKQYLFS